MENKLFRCPDCYSISICSIKNCDQRAIEEYCEDETNKLFLCEKHFLEKGKELEEKGIHSNFNKHKKYHEKQKKQRNRSKTKPLDFVGFL